MMVSFFFVFFFTLGLRIPPRAPCSRVGLQPFLMKMIGQRPLTLMVVLVVVRWEWH